LDELASFMDINTAHKSKQMPCYKGS